MRALALLFLVHSACIDFNAPNGGNPADERVFVVPRGATGSGLTQRLKDEGLIAGTWAWKLALRRSDASCIKAGKHKVRGNMRPSELLDALCSNPLPEDIAFTIHEGWRIRDIDEALVAHKLAKPGAYTKAAVVSRVEAPFDVESTSLEGYLYPETYMVVPESFTVEGLIKRQLDTFKERFLEPHAENLGDRSLHEVVVMASMLEREEPSDTNKPVVAGILWKRIDNGWKLGVDATSRYKLDEWNDRKAFLKMLRDPSDPYNTRLRDGLPPTAIGNPALGSLKAAISPKTSPYWYYLHDRSGTLHGSRNAAEHEATRKKFNVY